jgi:hypothetical protein
LKEEEYITRQANAVWYIYVCVKKKKIREEKEYPLQLIEYVNGM